MIILSTIISCNNNEAPIRLSVSNLSSTSLHFGDTLIITGTGFDQLSKERTITINNIPATILNITNNSITVKTPAVGDTIGKVFLHTSTDSILAGNINYTPDIFISGSGMGNNNNSIAKYWKNETPFSLSDGTKSEFSGSIFVNEQDIYVVAVDGGPQSLAKYWKNGIPVILSDGTKWECSNSIFINGNDVYVSGYEIQTDYKCIAKYWKNGIPVILSDGTKSESCGSIIVNKGDVYLSGSEMTTKGTMIKYWKNGTSVSLTDGTGDANAGEIFISGNDVFIAGYISDNNYQQNRKAIYWKNGIPTILTDGRNQAFASSIFKYLNDIYVTGGEKDEFNHQIAKYWKNGNPINLSSIDSRANKIFIYAGDIYITGQINHKAVYWKNGSPVYLPEGNSANDIYIR